MILPTYLPEHRLVRGWAGLPLARKPLLPYSMLPRTTHHHYYHLPAVLHHGCILPAALPRYLLPPPHRHFIQYGGPTGSTDYACLLYFLRFAVQCFYYTVLPAFPGLDGSFTTYQATTTTTYFRLPTASCHTIHGCSFHLPDYGFVYATMRRFNWLVPPLVLASYCHPSYYHAYPRFVLVLGRLQPAGYRQLTWYLRPTYHHRGILYYHTVYLLRAYIPACTRRFLTTIPTFLVDVWPFAGSGPLPLRSVVTVWGVWHYYLPRRHLSLYGSVGLPFYVRLPVLLDGSHRGLGYFTFKFCHHRFAVQLP